MAITKKYINADQTKLKTFLEDSGFFGSVTVDSSNSSFLDLYDDDDNLLCKLSPQQCILYWDDNASNHLDILLASGINTGVDYAYSCSNGIMLTSHRQSSYHSYVMITKTNLDKVAFIASFSGSTATSKNHVTSVFALAYGDDGTLAMPTQADNTYKPTVITPLIRNQSQLVPFVTYAEDGVISYTPNAGFFVYGQNYGSGDGSNDGKILINGDLYITNGYWAIKD